MITFERNDKTKGGKILKTFMVLSGGIEIFWTHSPFRLHQESIFVLFHILVIQTAVWTSTPKQAFFHIYI